MMLNLQSRILVNAAQNPRFGRKATEDEVKEIKALVRDHMPLASLNADHFFIIYPKGDFDPGSIIGMIQYFKEVKRYFSKDKNKIIDTMFKKNRVNAYAFFKSKGIDFTEEECKTNLLARTASRFICWQRERQISKSTDEEYYRKSFPWITVNDINIPGVRILRRIYGIKPPNKAEFDKRKVEAKAELTGLRKVKYSIEEAVIKVVAKILGA